MRQQIPPLNERLDWARDYKKNLELLRDDIELFTSSDIQVYIAMDFHDLYEHFFPADRIFDPRYQLLNEREEFFKRYHARSFLFYLNEITNEKIILLPPYLAEILDYFDILSKKLHLSVKDTRIMRDYVESIKLKLQGLQFKNLDKRGKDKLLVQIFKIAPDLVYLFSPSFMKGLDGFKEILIKQTTACPSEIDNYISHIERIHSMDHEHIMKIVNFLRPYRYIPNDRDAKAIQYIEEINKIIGTNQIFILFSSANPFEKFRAAIRCNKENYINGVKYPAIYCERQIGKIRYPLLRNTKSIYIALLEICNYFLDNNIKFENFDLKKLDPRKFQNMVNKDIDIITKFLNLFEGLEFENEQLNLKQNLMIYHGIDGIMLTEMENDVCECFENFRSLVIEREQLDLVKLIEMFRNHNKDLEYAKDFTDEKRVSILVNDIYWAINNKNLAKIIKEKINDIDETRHGIEQNIKKYFDASLLDQRCEMQILIAETSLAKALENSNLEDIRKAIYAKGVHILKDFTFKNFGEKKWCLFEPNRIYIINEEYGKILINIIDLRLMFLRISDIRQQIAEGNINTEFLKQMNILNTFKKAMPFYDDMIYENKSLLRISYHEILKNIDVVDAYRDFGYNLERIVWMK